MPTSCQSGIQQPPPATPKVSNQTNMLYLVKTGECGQDMASAQGLEYSFSALFSVILLSDVGNRFRKREEMKIWIEVDGNLSRGAPF